jgi:putative DNA methylase
MRVRSALQEINYFLEDFLAQQEGDLDVESQFCVTWFQQYGAKQGPFGEADVLSRAKNISVETLSRLGLVNAAKGWVQLKLRENYEDGWDPRTQSQLTAWEACQRLVWTLHENGEQETGRLARHLGGLADRARELAFRLYGIADRKGWSEEAQGYNNLVASWPEIQKAAAASAEETQGRMV